MEEETEKMMALKKVYAEIILNTAKEAAARIMASERRAQLCRNDLSLMKDEALRLLLRLKQTMDVKIDEAEIKSQDQQRKIEVLEAQLQEAEDIVSNLRVELNEAHRKLEILSKNKTYRGFDATHKAESQNGNLRPVLASRSDQISHDAQEHSSAAIYLKESGYLGEPEIPSIISRRKEPARYLNGCIQSLRTCNGNFLKDDFRYVKALREDKEGENVSENTSVEEEGHVDVKEVEDEEPVELTQVSKLLKKRRKGSSRYEKNSVSPIKRVSHTVNETCSDLSTSHDHEPGSQSVKESDNCDMSTEGVIEDIQASKSLAANTQQSTSGGSLDALHSSIETAEMKSPSSSNLDVKLAEFSDGLSSPLAKDRVLKYTFQRKRKRESVASDENPLTERMTKKQNGNLEHVNSGEVTESLRDGRRMELVAHQLLSMSEKKWIK